MNSINKSPVGKLINDMLILGVERDGKNRWVGADLEVNVQEIGSFFMRVVTKQQYLSEKLENALEDMQTVTPEWFDEATPEEKPAFVLNDSEINEDILNNKFINRRVEQDLADSLWPIPED